MEINEQSHRESPPPQIGNEHVPDIQKTLHVPKFGKLINWSWASRPCKIEIFPNFLGKLFKNVHEIASFLGLEDWLFLP